MVDAARAQQLVDEMRQVMIGVIEAVEAGGDLGVPGHILHAGLIDVMTLPQFERLIEMLAHAGFLEKRGEVYFVGRRSIKPLRILWSSRSSAVAYRSASPPCSR